MFHFLAEEPRRRAYAEQVERCVRPKGFVLISTFAPDGPERCSGLPVARYSPGEIQLCVFPRMFGLPNLSPFCCKLETRLRIAKIPYTVVETSNPRTAPRRKLPYIEEGGVVSRIRP